MTEITYGRTVSETLPVLTKARQSPTLMSSRSLIRRLSVKTKAGQGEDELLVVLRGRVTVFGHLLLPSRFLVECIHVWHPQRRGQCLRKRRKRIISTLAINVGILTVVAMIVLVAAYFCASTP